MVCISKGFISEVFIPSAKEYEEWVATVPNIPMQTKRWWWLATPGQLSCRMQVVNYDGTVCESGGNVADPCIGVRPAFRFNLGTALPGSKVRIGKVTCTMINLKTALCDDIVFYSRVNENEDDNQYETSELAKKLRAKVFEVIN